MILETIWRAIIRWTVIIGGFLTLGWLGLVAGIIIAAFIPQPQEE